MASRSHLAPSAITPPHDLKQWLNYGLQENGRLAKLPHPYFELQDSQINWLATPRARWETKENKSAEESELRTNGISESSFGSGLESSFRLMTSLSTSVSGSTGTENVSLQFKGEKTKGKFTSEISIAEKIEGIAWLNEPLLLHPDFKALVQEITGDNNNDAKKIKEHCKTLITRYGIVKPLSQRWGLNIVLKTDSHEHSVHEESGKQNQDKKIGRFLFGFRTGQKNGISGSVLKGKNEKKGDSQSQSKSKKELSGEQKGGRFLSRGQDPTEWVNKEMENFSHWYPIGFGSIKWIWDFFEGMKRKRLQDALFDSFELIPLIEFVRADNYDEVKERVNAGADVNIEDEEGISPLYAAAYGGFTRIADFLLEEGADVNHETLFGTSPLSVAIWRDNTDTALLLLAAKAIPDFENVFGDTLLHEAVNNANETLVLALLKAHCDPTEKNLTNQTPMDLAKLEEKKLTHKFATNFTEKDLTDTFNKLYLETQDKILSDLDSLKTIQLLLEKEIERKQKQAQTSAQQTSKL